MNLKKTIPLLFCLIFFINAQSVFANSTIKMLFCFPGLEGSQELAQPLLDNLAQELTQSTGQSFEIHYKNEMTSQAPWQNTDYDLALVSHELYMQFGKHLPVILTAKSLPESNGNNQYFIIGSQDSLKQSNLKLNTSGTWRKEDLEILFRDLPKTLQIFSEQKLIPSLKKASVNSGELVLLTSFQFNNLKKLKSPWAKDLLPIYQSRIIPSYPLLKLKDKPLLNEAFFHKIESLTKSATLNELRLNGFTLKNSQNYSKLIFGN